MLILSKLKEKKNRYNVFNAGCKNRFVAKIKLFSSKKNNNNNNKSADHHDSINGENFKK